jgi:hypothetical protein
MEIKYLLGVYLSVCTSHASTKLDEQVFQYPFLPEEKIDAR